MFRYILKALRFRQMQKDREKEEVRDEPEVEPEFSQDLTENLNALQAMIQRSSDIMIRRFSLGSEHQTQAAVLFIDGLVEKSLVYDNILKPLMYDVRFFRARETYDLEFIESALLFVGDVQETASMQKAIDSFLGGDTVLLVDGARKALVISLHGWKIRSIEEPKTESVVRGPREGFTENLRSNTAMLRRKIKSPDFMLKTMQIGARTKTDVCVAYIDGLADPKLIEEIRRRLGRIHTDAILESGYIEQFIEDAPYSIFSTIANSEKPDKVAAKLLEGRAAILVDGTPFVLTAPMLFVESFQTGEDYYSRPFYASFVRLLRYASYLISISAPALYVALANFHQELIPSSLLLTMAAAHEGVPFPSVLEAGLMVFAFEILREAGVRLPRPIGQAVSIVGALVIGESAVSAGLIGAPMVIVVAVTAVSSFVVPAQIDSGAFLRMMLLVMAGVMGGYGIAIVLFATYIHLASLRSFGTPYLSPLAPFQAKDLKDTLVRAPLWSMDQRPADIPNRDAKRQSAGMKPTPPPEQKDIPS